MHRLNAVASIHENQSTMPVAEKFTKYRLTIVAPPIESGIKDNLNKLKAIISLFIGGGGHNPNYETP